MHSLGEFAEIFDGPHATPKKTKVGPIFLGVSSLTNGRLDLSDAAHLSEEDFRKWTRRVTPAPGDVVFSYETRLGAAALIPEGIRCCLGRRMGLLRVKSSEVEPRYLLYGYLGPQFQQVIRDRTIHGSTVDRIPLKDMGAFRIVLPPHAEQKRIAGILGTLDDKIDSNRRLAQRLEQTCATLFQGQFVDLILADGQGGSTSDWNEAPLGDLVSSHRESGSSELPYIGLSQMPRSSTILSEWLGDEAPDGHANRFRRGDILVGKLRPYFRKVGVAPIDGRCSTEILVLRANDGRYWGFVLGHVASQAFIDHCVAVSRGTRMPRAEWKDAGSFRVRVPPPDVAGTHTEVVRDLYGKIHALVMESRTLASARDALLPKLVSGEIRVPDSTDPGEIIEPLVEEHAA